MKTEEIEKKCGKKLSRNNKIRTLGKKYQKEVSGILQKVVTVTELSLVGPSIYLVYSLVK